MWHTGNDGTQARWSWEGRTNPLLQPAEANSVIQFFSQMLKLPVAAVAAGLEIVARIVRDVQQTFDRNVDVVAESMAQSLMDQTAAADIQSQAAEGAGQVVTQDGIAESDPATQKHGGN